MTQKYHLPIIRDWLTLPRMEPVAPTPQSQPKQDPNLFWEGFYFLTFFIFFNIVLIPYAPKSLTFDQYYPVAMIFFGGTGLLVGRGCYLVMKNWPEWTKFTLHAVLYLIILYYLIDNIEKFTIPW